MEIDKGIPIPKPHIKSGRERNFPWKDMMIGDSFLYPGVQGQASSACNYPSKKYGFKFTTRKVEGGTRIWRVA